MDSDGPTTVALTVAASAWRDVDDELETLAERIVRGALESGTDQAWLRAGEVSLVLTDDAEIRSLNATYRQKDRATNVLSFPGLDLVDGAGDIGRAPGAVMLGDIVISHERLIEEAAELGKAPRDHFAHLLVHGTLHLLGYDHEDEARARLMEGLEAVILKKLGFAVPYTMEPTVDDAPATLSAIS